MTLYYSSVNLILKFGIFKSNSTNLFAHSEFMECKASLILVSYLSNISETIIEFENYLLNTFASIQQFIFVSKY